MLQNKMKLIIIIIIIIIIISSSSSSSSTWFVVMYPYFSKILSTHMQKYEICTEWFSLSLFDSLHVD